MGTVPVTVNPVSLIDGDTLACILEYVLKSMLWQQQKRAKKRARAKENLLRQKVIRGILKEMERAELKRAMTSQDR